MSNPRSFWITGATNGLGLALVERLLDQGQRVAASGMDSQELDDLDGQLTRLPGQLHEMSQAEVAAQRLQAQWGALDTLIINAGTCDYLTNDVADTELFDMIVSSNLRATEHCLGAAVPLLARGQKPQVMVILNRYSALQRFEPTQPPNGENSLPQWLRDQRTSLQTLGIDLTVVAPQSLRDPVTLAQAVPEDWTPQTAAAALLARLEQRQPELVLEALSLNSLWPLSR
ncbi:SDR family oxidoreductase [Pseudomonas sp. UFMG81]|uniref:SDR family oxidoreductase n=1 Tax=Pseudomonas sp. UFMG81 TaxID=2745936 RepID=UPI00188F7999|nr:SDR family oxidoreductase [Pseudomonas sp. UFMG81]